MGGGIFGKNVRARIERALSSFLMGGGIFATHGPTEDFRRVTA